MSSKEQHSLAPSEYLSSQDSASSFSLDLSMNSSLDLFQPTNDIYSPFSQDDDITKELVDFLAKNVLAENDEFQITSAIRYDPLLLLHGTDTTTSEEDDPNNDNDKNLENINSVNDAVTYIKSSVSTKNSIPGQCFFLLALHQKRLQFAANFFGWNVSLTPQLLKQELDKAISQLDVSKPYKV